MKKNTSLFPPCYMYCVLKRKQPSTSSGQDSNTVLTAPSEKQHKIRQHTETAASKATATITKGTNIDQTESTTSSTNTSLSTASTKSANVQDTLISSTITIPTYGPPVFPTAIQILPLEPHFSDEDSSNIAKHHSRSRRKH